jgi:outer membrane protein assembly factor BamB
MNKSGVCAAVGAVLITTAYAGSWPQYGGPDRTNISAAAIKDGKVYLIDRDGDNSLVRCLDLDSGNDLWRVSFADPGEMKGKKFAGTRGIPTVTDDAVYLVTGYGAFVCIDLQSHRVKWKHSLVKDYGNELHQFGIAQSPFIHGDLVLVAPNTEQVGAAAYDKKSGRKVWTSPGLGKHAFVTPQVVKLCGQEMVVAVGSKERPPKTRGRRSRGESPPPDNSKPLVPGHIVGLSLKDGSILWDYQGWQCQAAIPFPTLVEGDRLFITGGYDAGSAMIRIVRDGAGFAVQELYTTEEVGSQLHQPIQVGQHFFIGSNSNSRKDGLACFSLDGRLEWRTKDIDGAPNFERGSFILADGKLILLDGKTGMLYLVQADISGYKQLASSKMVKENDMAWAPLALADGKLLVRDWTSLKCVDLK